MSLDLGILKLRARLEKRYLEDLGYSSGQQFLAKIVASVDCADTLLDAGCGEGELLQQLPSAVRYVGLDKYSGKQRNEYNDWDMRPSVIGDLHNLPLISLSVKTVVMMQVLEHMKDPPHVLSEITRVLEFGGYLFITVPFLHEIHHAPNDFFRYTPFSLAQLAQTAGLEVIEIRPSGGYFRALAHILGEAPTVVDSNTASALAVRLFVAYPLKGLGWVLRKLQYLLDLQDDTQVFTSGYDCIFRKQLEGSN